MSDSPNALSVAAQIAAAVQKAPLGTYKRYLSAGTGVDFDIHQHIKNLRQISDRIQHAQEHGCLLEVIDLRFQTIDFWLRIYFVNRAPCGSQRPKEFGRLLNECHQRGLKGALHGELVGFNKKRIDACHGFVVGRTDYERLEDVTENSKTLAHEVMLFVIDGCGEILEKFEGYHDVGDMVLNVAQARLMITAGSTGGLG